MRRRVVVSGTVTIVSTNTNNITDNDDYRD